MALEELRLSGDRKTLTVVLNGEAHPLPAEYLRVFSPSAEVRGHGGPALLISGKRAVSIYKLQPVGNYALQIIFSDGHSSGIYSWALLEELARHREANWTRYLAALAAAGKSRDRR